jgi:hypothetical protein
MINSENLISMRISSEDTTEQCEYRTVAMLEICYGAYITVRCKLLLII